MKRIYLVVCFFLALNIVNVQIWVQKFDFPDEARYATVKFTIDDIAYVGLGKDGTDYFGDF